jgi:hypothetical protein
VFVLAPVDPRTATRDQLTQEHIGALVIKAVEKADSGDSILLKFMLEQPRSRLTNTILDNLRRRRPLFRRRHVSRGQKYLRRRLAII